MTLDEVIKLRLAEATLQVEAAKPVELKKADKEADEVGSTVADEVDTKPTTKKTLTKEETEIVAPVVEVVATEVEVVAPTDKKSSVSEQVSSLLETEGLSEDFKLQAVTIFEAAITDRVMVIEAELKTEFDSQLATAKAELDNDIDGFLSEAIQQWKQENEVAIKANFKSQVAESFIDGMKALIAEHNIEVPEDKENALEVAIAEVDKLNESIVAKSTEMLALQEQVNTMTAEKILESFKTKMTQTEFDRFTQLTESVKFTDEAQYTKQLTIVLENFGSTKNTKVDAVAPLIEAVSESVQTILTETNSDMSAYASYIATQR